jgi:transposase-like protein
MDKIKYECEECGETFAGEVELEEHNRKVHSRYTCQNCLETFDEEQAFEAHNLKTHPEPHKAARSERKP